MLQNKDTGFITSPLAVTLQRRPSLPCYVKQGREKTHKLVATSSKRRVRMLFLDPIHTMPEFMNQLIVSCGVGIMGVVGSKVTEEARSLQQADHRAEKMDTLNADIESFQRRRELANVKMNRGWGDVKIDRYSNVLVEAEEVPELESEDDLEAFDRLLMDSPAAKRLVNGQQTFQPDSSIPDVQDYLLDEEDEQM